jgi:hypothetical protein
MINASGALLTTGENKHTVVENLQVALSVTRTSHDPTPWVSLAIGVLR